MSGFPNPTFTIFIGPMFSAKTSKLLMTLERFKYQRKKSVVFKPQIDDRYAEDSVVTHSGWSAPAHSIKNGNDIIDALIKIDDEPNVIAVDEAFMIPGIAEVLIWLYRQGINVVVSTLDLSSMGKPFSEIEKMLIWATHIEKCAAVCTVCGKDAFYTHKKTSGHDDDSKTVQVGGADMYEPRCSRCHPHIMNHDVILNGSKD